MKNRLKELDWSSKIMKQNNKKDNPCKFCNVNDDSYGKDFSKDEYVEFKLYRVKDDYYIYNYSAYSDPTSDWLKHILERLIIVLNAGGNYERNYCRSN